jgi:hypothetical protein
MVVIVPELTGYVAIVVALTAARLALRFYFTPDT